MRNIKGKCDLSVAQANSDSVGIAILNLHLNEHYGTAQKDHAEHAHVMSMHECKALASRLKSTNSATSNSFIAIAGVTLTIEGRKTHERQRRPNSAVIIFDGLPTFEAHLSGDDAEGLAELLMLATKKGWRERSSAVRVPFSYSYEDIPGKGLREASEAAFYAIELPTA